jgi:hypothetical protein
LTNEGMCDIHTASTRCPTPPFPFPTITPEKGTGSLYSDTICGVAPPRVIHSLWDRLWISDFRSARMWAWCCRNLARKGRTAGRKEHSLLDGDSPSAPSDLRPPFATTPYHKKLRMFQSAVGEGQYVLRLLGQTPDFWCNYGSWGNDETWEFAAPISLPEKRFSLLADQSSSCHNYRTKAGTERVSCRY